MNLLTSTTPIMLWQEVVRNAEDRCSVALQEELEVYLVSLLIRFINKPEVSKSVFATAFLQALHLHKHERDVSLQHVGDQCLLFAGLFPHAAERRHVKISYFVDLGRSSYSAISHKTNDLYDSLALQFVALMDVLQSIPSTSTQLLPLAAYEQWQAVGSQRAFKLLQAYAKGVPVR